MIKAEARAADYSAFRNKAPQRRAHAVPVSCPAPRRHPGFRGRTPTANKSCQLSRAPVRALQTPRARVAQERVPAACVHTLARSDACCFDLRSAGLLNRLHFTFNESAEQNRVR